MTKQEQIEKIILICLKFDIPVGEMANRIVKVMEFKHDFWMAGEPNRPRDIVAPNGELTKLRCRNCNLDNPQSTWCAGWE